MTPVTPSATAFPVAFPLRSARFTETLLDRASIPSTSGMPHFASAMHLFPFFHEMPYLYLLQTAFMIWILVDCYRRGAEVFWFWVILIIPGFGAWAYFFVVKIHDFHHLERISIWPFRSRPSMSELRYRVERSPTTVNQMEMAQRLIENGEPAEAMPHLQSVLAREPEYCQALYSLAVCHSQLGQPDAAVPLLEKVNARDRRWSNYRAWHLLIDSRIEFGDKDGALATCRELVKHSATLQHQCLLGERLVDAGKLDEALGVIERGLEDQDFLPFSRRWRNRRWINEARRLQKRILNGKTSGNA